MWWRHCATGRGDLRERFMEELDPLDADRSKDAFVKGLPELGVLLRLKRNLAWCAFEHGDLFPQEDVSGEKLKPVTWLTQFAVPLSSYQGRFFAR